METFEVWYMLSRYHSPKLCKFSLLYKFAHFQPEDYYTSELCILQECRYYSGYGNAVCQVRQQQGIWQRFPLEIIPRNLPLDISFARILISKLNHHFDSHAPPLDIKMSPNWRVFYKSSPVYRTFSHIDHILLLKPTTKKAGGCAWSDYLLPN